MVVRIESFWENGPPPQPSPRLEKWIKKIKTGWKPNKRISRMGYYEKAHFFGVYIWEYLHILYPLLKDYA